MKHRAQSLASETIEILAPYFPDYDLRRIRIYQGIPWYVPGLPQGYTDRHRIYLAKNAAAIETVEGLALLAHEITHCLQYRRYGTWRFRWLYLKAYFLNRRRGMPSRQAYFNNPFEAEARLVEEIVRDRIEGAGWDE